MTTTMITKFVSSQSSDNIYTAIETLLQNNASGTVADYGGSFRVFAVETQILSGSPDVATICAGGSYISDGSGTVAAGIPVPFVVHITTTRTILESQQPDWVNSDTATEIGFNSSCQDPTAFPNFREMAGITAIASVGGSIKFPSASDGFVIVGQVYFKSPAGVNLPNSGTSPIVVAVDKVGNFTILSDELNNINEPTSWLTTDLGLANPYQPMQLNDIYWDATNDALLSVGGMADNGGTIISVGMVVESTSEGDFTVLAVGAAEQVAANTLTAGERCFYRRCVKINNSAAKPIFLLGGCTSYSATEFPTGVLSLYTPNWAVPWGGFNPRIGILDRGRGLVQDFYQNASGLALTQEEAPQDINFIERVTKDGEDIIFVGGNNNPDSSSTDTSLFLWSFTPPTVGDDTIAPLGVSTQIIWPEQKNLSSTLKNSLTAAGFNVYHKITPMGIVGLSNRKAKIITGGAINPNFIYPRNGFITARSAFILAISRGMNLWQNTLENQTPSLSEISLKVSNYNTTSPLSGADFILLNNQNPQDAAEGGSLTSQLVTTGRIAKAYFEYLLYDGVDGLVAKKLQQLGIRVTITNVEWYKQKILKQSLDLDADFFRDWANLQEQQNAERDRLNERYGATRPAKRSVRTELFDEYAHMEELLDEMDKLREAEPDFEVPWSDEVRDAQEARIREKVALDITTIDELAEKDELDSVEELEGLD